MTGAGPARALMIAAPHSGAGKTMVTLGLLRALARNGLDVTSAKSGPDYIDPAFHAAASGGACVNLDAWAMAPGLIRALAAQAGGAVLIAEAAMGLFDGAPDADDPMGRGSAADLAALLGCPVVLVVDAGRMSQSVAALVSGFARARADLVVAGVILNRVGSDRHRDMLVRALGTTGVPVLGAIGREQRLQRPSRHLGLVQAGEDAGLHEFINGAADVIAGAVDLDALVALARPLAGPVTLATAAPFPAPPLPVPPGQRVAIARDQAFAFAYPHLLAHWRALGASIAPFSPLADQAPDPDANAVVLPGGYPELHAGTLAAAAGFRAGMLAAAARGAQVWGECGGYMVLGRSLTDAQGQVHPMLGLLPVQTSFAIRKMTLGYRHLRALAGPWAGQNLTGHEFHYATITAEDDTGRLFAARDALGTDLGLIGHARGTVAGSFAHVIAAATAQG